MVSASLTNSIWIAWLTRHTAIQQAAGWLPVGADSTTIPLFPDFILPLLPESQGLTPHGRTCRCALGLFTLAAIVALLSSGWNNRELLNRLSFDVAHYYRLSMDDYIYPARSVAPD